MIDDLIVFLDFDGVVNTPTWREWSDGEFTCRFSFADDGFVNNFQACCWLNELYKDHPYKIVVTSTWAYRNSIEDLSKCLYNGGLSRDIEILDKTNIDFNKRRNEEVLEWLQDHSYKKFIIFDDEDVYDKQLKKVLIKTDSNVGITLNEFAKAEDLIEKLN